jgi:hypothetical protein
MGPLDPGKVTEVAWQGQVLRGVYLEPEGAQAGLLDITEYADSGVADTSTEFKSGGPFDQQCAQNRLEAIGASMAGASEFQRCMSAQPNSVASPCM